MPNGGGVGHLRTSTTNSAIASLNEASFAGHREFHDLMTAFVHS